VGILKRYDFCPPHSARPVHLLEYILFSFYSHVCRGNYSIGVSVLISVHF